MRYIGIRFGRIAPGKTEPEWFFIPHKECDGIGGFAQLLRQRGAILPRLPGVKHPANPSMTAVLRALPKYLKPRHKLKWLTMESKDRVDSRGTPPPAVAWHVFSEDESTQIRHVCRNAGYTVNSFLLKHLTKAIRPSLQDDSAVVPWMVPVNLRGKVVRDRDTSNFSSYVSVNVRSYETVYDIHRQIYEALGRGEHWANWYGYQLGRFTTAGMRRLLVDTGLAMPQWHIGGFSNLGNWDMDKEITGPDALGSWLFSPPVLRCQHIGAGCVTFQNRLSLTVHLHPEATTDPAVPRGWVQAWVKEIEIDIASVLHRPAAQRNGVTNQGR